MLIWTYCVFAQTYKFKFESPTTSLREIEMISGESSLEQLVSLEGSWELCLKTIWLQRKSKKGPSACKVIWFRQTEEDEDCLPRLCCTTPLLSKTVIVLRRLVCQILQLVKKRKLLHLTTSYVIINSPTVGYGNWTDPIETVKADRRTEGIQIAPFLVESSISNGALEGTILAFRVPSNFQRYTVRLGTRLALGGSSDLDIVCMASAETQADVSLWYY